MAMLAKRFRRLAWFCGLAAALAGRDGPVNALVALGEPGEASFDPRLIGDWYTYNDRDRPQIPHLSIRRADGGQLLDAVVIVWLEEKRSPPVIWLRASAFPSEIGGKTYFNVFDLTCANDKNCLDRDERLG